MDDVRVVGPERRLHHELHELVGERRDGRPERGGHVGLELRLAAQQLRDVDVGEPRFGRDVREAFPGLRLRRQQPRNYGRRARAALLHDLSVRRSPVLPARCSTKSWGWEGEARDESLTVHLVVGECGCNWRRNDGESFSFPTVIYLIDEEESFCTELAEQDVSWATPQKKKRCLLGHVFM